jgi:hypothetical protein
MTVPFLLPTAKAIARLPTGDRNGRQMIGVLFQPSLTRDAGGGFSPCHLFL